MSFELNIMHLSPIVKRLASVVIGLVIFSGVVYAAFRIIGSKAADIAPRNVTISDITVSSGKITWSTDQPAIGAIKYGTTEGSLNFYAPENIKDPAQSHSVDLTLLSPGSTYYFQIQIGDKMYDNGGVSWTFATKGNEQTAVPTAAPLPTAAAVSPTVAPIQTIKIPNTSPTVAPAVCSATTCDAIKAQFGISCSIQDYIKKGCLNTPTP